jgi:hypothetical protein
MDRIDLLNSLYTCIPVGLNPIKEIAFSYKAGYPSKDNERRSNGATNEKLRETFVSIKATKPVVLDQKEPIRPLSGIRKTISQKINEKDQKGEFKSPSDLRNGSTSILPAIENLTEDHMMKSPELLQSS